MRRVVMAVSALAALACSGAMTGTPVPSEHEDLIGDWTAPEHTLSIQADGMVAYEHASGSTKTSVNGGVTTWTDTSFTVMGISTFTIDEAPHQEGGTWEATIDGVDYTRPGDAEDEEDAPARERPGRGEKGRDGGKGKAGKGKKRP